MIYEYVHWLFTELLIDASTLPIEFQYLIFFAELYAVFWFLKFALIPFSLLIQVGNAMSKSFGGARRSIRSRDYE